MDLWKYFKMIEIGKYESSKFEVLKTSYICFIILIYKDNYFM